MISLRRRFSTGLIAISLLTATAPTLAYAAAPAPTNLGTFKTWTAWQGQDDYGKMIVDFRHGRPIWGFNNA